MFGVDKFPRMTDYVLPTGVRIADADRVRLGAHLAEGTTVMHEGFVNYNAGTLGASMVEGRISAGVVVGDGSDVGGGASIMGTLSGGGKEVISVGRRCLIGANAGIGISLGDDCVVEAGCYVTAGTKVSVLGADGPGGQGLRALRREHVLFRRNSTTGAVEATAWGGDGHRAERRPACQLGVEAAGRPARRSCCWPASRSRPACSRSTTGAWGRCPTPRAASASVGGVVVDLSTEQAENATTIVAVGVRRGLPARAASIALATAYQESKLRNLDHGDRDSLGLFQQRPSQGWGTAAQIQDPYYAVNRFYDALVKVDGYQTMRITEAAQEVQRSGFPEAYEDHAADGRALASALTGYSRARFSCVVDDPGSASPEALDRNGLTPRADRVRRDLRKAFGPLPLGGYAPGGVSTGHMKGSAHYEGRAIDVFVRPISAANKRTGLGDRVVPRRARLPARHRPRHLRQADLDRRGPLRAGLAGLRPRQRPRGPQDPGAPRPRARRRTVTP